MSSATALTIIAISLAILALIAIVAVAFLVRLVMHLMAFEENLVHELAELRLLVAEVRETTQRVGSTVHDVQIAARRIGGIMGAVASLFLGRRTSPPANETPSRVWWLTGLSLGWSLLKRRRKKKKQKRTKSAPPTTGGSLPL